MSPEKLKGNIEKRMERVKTYHLKMEMEIFSPEALQVYSIEQWFQSPGKYRLEMSGGEARQVIISSGEDIWIYHPELKDYYRISEPLKEESHTPFLLSGFWNNLLNARELTIIGEERHDNSNFYILEVIPQEQTSHWFKEIIWLEKKKLVPFLIEVYDDQGSQVSEFRYQEIVINNDISPELFESDFSWEEAQAQCQALSLTMEEVREAVDFPLKLPSYLPSGVQLDLITMSEEPGCRSVIFHYRGLSQFSLIQNGPVNREGELVETAAGVNAVGAERVSVGDDYGFIREDQGINTLFWQFQEQIYIITGELEPVQMVKVASSLCD
ncbi:LolA family protein [Candidatus Contubernalis alkaliaceticus]|uniref:LolA family protein n=1 Tax=Candidatus Contubernalis alkaliaceticus TaxID=338645 RepID=UPI001F4C30B6|nr:outer membrane lipoprotein-sorting protein [Candidatus Contubernalis alkalaceticus]UNC91430.1 outer membrane lipoprotein carrier protein LolA [Candidatus Contubernalis alkalaceticus]